MMTSQILVSADNPGQKLKRGLLFLFLLIFFILYSAVSWAQNALIQVYDAQAIMLKTANPGALNFLAPGNDFGLPPEHSLEASYPTLFYRNTVPVKSGSVFRNTDRFELFKEYLKQFAAEKATDPASGREMFRGIYNKPGIDEKSILRREWEEAFGFDVWSPYYKYKEIERQVKSKLSVKVFKLKGEPRLEKGKFFYVFAAAF